MIWMDRWMDRLAFPERVKNRFRKNSLVNAKAEKKPYHTFFDKSDEHSVLPGCVAGSLTVVHTWL